MKTKIASVFLFFFLFFPAFAAEVPSLKEAGDKADSIFQRTWSRFKYAGNGLSENFSFAYYALYDRAVVSRRHAEARAKAGISDAKEKTSDMISGAKKSTAKTYESAKEKTGEVLNETGETIRDKYNDTKKKVGEVVFE